MASSKRVEEEGKLCRAAGNGDVEEVLRLLDRGVDIEAAAAAAAAESAAAVAAAVAAAAAAAGYYYGFKNPLMWASSEGHEKCVKVLLEKGAKVNVQDRRGMTALIWAAQNGHIELLKLLLDRGAAVNIKDKDGWTPLMCVVRYEKMKCMKVLLDNGAQVDMQDKDGTTPLMWATREGKMECMKVLLDNGAQVDMKDKSGRTPLMWAALRGNMECVKVLLDKGAQVDMQDKGGWTPLMWAVHKGNMECMKVLLDHGAQVDMQDKDGWTALMEAARNGHWECVKLLLDRGAAVNIKDNDGWTPLMWAVRYKKMECIKVLLDYGAQVDMKDKNGMTPLMWATDGGSMKVLLDNGAQVDMQDKDGMTLLMKAAQNGDIEVLKLLLDRGAAANIKDNDGNTALHLAAKRDKYEDQTREDKRVTCVRTLLSHPGMDINIRNNEGRTAMMVAGFKSLGVFRKVVKTCSEFRADSYGKVVLCGHSGAGKSTLTQAIISISRPAGTRFMKRMFGNEDVVEPLTAGIIPHQVDSSYSNMVVYDLAGHHQYFSSHSACLEAITVDTPAIFLLLQDLRKDPETMTTEVYYWSTMIDGVCHKCPKQSSVIVVGTHADLLIPEQLTKRMELLKALARNAINHQKLIDVISLNLTKIYSGEMDQFSGLLYKTNKDVLSMAPPISMMCHMMLAFFNEKLPPDMDAISLSDLVVRIKAYQDDIISPDSSTIVPILKTLSEKGLILYIPSEDPLNSWIVLHKETILKKVNGALFADSSQKEYIRVASNTGIVPRGVIEEKFPEYNTEMITQFMIHFELCQALHLSHIDTNMAPEDSSNSDLGPLFFFPALVSVDRPSSVTVPKNSFCWSIIVKSPNTFFTTRFLHVLLHRLPSEFALPAVQATPEYSHLHRRCDVWSKGIQWLSNPGVTTIVEMSDRFQSLSLAMFSSYKADPKYLNLAHCVLAVIKKACHEFCPHLEVLEIVSCPPEASSDHSDDTKVELSSLKKAVLDGEKSIVDVSGRKHVMMEEWMRIEPCLPSLIEAPPMAPPSTCLLLLSTVSHSTENGSTSSPCDLRDLLNDIASKIPAKWRLVGIQLGLSSGTLDSIQSNNAGKPQSCLDSFEQVFSTWERLGPSPYTWNAIIDVLRTPAVGEVALANELDARRLRIHPQSTTPQAIANS